jgi:formylglycine-generating enzyme required for sulfatase activity
MGNNPSENEGDNLPVENITWYDAVEFCNKKSELDGLEPCYSGNNEFIECDFSKNGYRLPTEAEWEFAARGGISGSIENYKYSGSDNISEVAWFEDNSASKNALKSYWRTRKTHPVGVKKANKLGIYDMSGNVKEWCNDWYDKSYYNQSSGLNPKGPKKGNNRVTRGGSCESFYRDCLITKRSNKRPLLSYNDLGFRLLRRLSH